MYYSRSHRRPSLLRIHLLLVVGLGLIALSGVLVQYSTIQWAWQNQSAFQHSRAFFVPVTNVAERAAGIAGTLFLWALFLLPITLIVHGITLYRDERDAWNAWHRDRRDDADSQKQITVVRHEHVYFPSKRRRRRR